MAMETAGEANPDPSAWLLFSAEGQAAKPRVGLLARRVQALRACCRFTFPGRAGRVAFEATRPRSQWRNRAGLAPDFPVMPLVGTQGPRTVALRFASGQEKMRNAANAASVDAT